MSQTIENPGSVNEFAERQEIDPRFALASYTIALTDYRQLLLEAKRADELTEGEV